MEVIGAGNGRTGTTSLKAALEILGFDPCYHMSDVFAGSHGSFWVRHTNKQAVDFDEIFGPKKFKASCDFPSAIFWKEQLQQYPNAKVILTIRDPEKWYKSCCDTTFHMLPFGPYSSLGSKIAMWASGISEMFTQVIYRDFYKCDLSKEHAIKCYKEHNEKVIAECPPEKLLIFEVSQGWEPLCTFLNRPIPSVPFPNANDTAAFKKNVAIVEAVGYVAVVVVVVPIASMLYYFGAK